MNQKRYFELRNLEENIDLTDEEFHKKYQSEFGDKYNYKENKGIRDLNSFKDRMYNMKNNIEKRTIDL